MTDKPSSLLFFLMRATKRGPNQNIEAKLLQGYVRRMSILQKARGDSIYLFLGHRVGCLSEALGAFIFVLVIALNAVALAAVAWGVQSSSGAALLGAVAGFRREARQSLRWLGAIVPTLIVIYAVVAPFVRA
jgi:hypothetical protein